MNMTFQMILNVEKKMMTMVVIVNFKKLSAHLINVIVAIATIHYQSAKRCSQQGRDTLLSTTTIMGASITKSNNDGNKKNNESANKLTVSVVSNITAEREKVSLRPSLRKHKCRQLSIPSSTGGINSDSPEKATTAAVCTKDTSNG